VTRSNTRQIDALRNDILETRAQLGETVQALAAKADIRSRARGSASRAAGRMRTAQGSAVPWAALAVAGAVVVAVMMTRRRYW
jgi:hypothetical protein